MEHGKLTEWNWLPLYPEQIEMGRDVDIGAFTLLNGKGGIVIGDRVQIGPYCSILSYNTIGGNWVDKIIICDAAEIGAYCLILPGARIGKHALIKAYATISGFVPDGGVVEKYGKA
jgi:serine acetyltransferase